MKNKKLTVTVFALFLIFTTSSSAAPINLPNLLVNPSFESGTNAPLNWSFVTNNGNTPVWGTISHSGNRSVKISIPGTEDSKSGYPRSDLIRAEPLQYYTLSAWVKTQNTGGTNAPAVRVAELDINKNWLRKTNLVLNRGTTDWTQKQITFQTDINTSWIYVYANIWDGYGTFWIDDVELRHPVYYDPGDKIIYVRGNVTLAEISRTLNDNSLLEKVTSKVWLLKVPVVVLQNGALHITNSNTKELRLLSMNNSDVTYLRILGKMEINGVNITSWNSNKNAPAPDTDYYRAYIIAEGYNSDLRILNSYISYLGVANNKDAYYKYARPQERGVVYNKVNKGKVTNVSFSHIGELSISGPSSNINIDGVNTYYSLINGIAFEGNVSKSEIKNSRVINSSYDGIKINIYNANGIPSNIRVINNRVINSTGEGISVLNSVTYSNFENNYINRTGKEGFDIEGYNTHSLVFRNNSIENANFDGYFLYNVKNITIQDSKSGVNRLSGIQLWNSSSVKIRNNVFYNNLWVGMNFAKDSDDILVLDSTILSEKNGILISNASNIVLENNTMDTLWKPYVFGWNTATNSYAHNIIFRGVSVDPSRDFKKHTENITYTIS